MAEPSFRSEMERQLLEIREAFDAFVDDKERERRDAEDRLRDMERRSQAAGDRLSALEAQNMTVEVEKRALEDQLREAGLQMRKLQKAPAARLARFIARLNPLGPGPKR